jgi:hypothetical protein
LASASREELLGLHRRNNRASAASWGDFADHRAKLTGLVAAIAAAPGERLAILGAGNCNDLDLPALSAQYREIHLVDLDDEALRRAQGKQLPSVASSLILRAPLDVSGSLELLPRYADQPSCPARLEELAHACAEQVVAQFPEPFDAAVSACVLSQIMVGCRLVLGKQRPDLKAVSHALAVGHLRALVRLVRPGGTALLVTDTCASSVYPPLADLWRRLPPSAVLEQLDENEKVFVGTRRSTIRAALATDPVLASMLGPGAPELVEPWLWTMGPMELLVYGVLLRRAGPTR